MPATKKQLEALAEVERYSAPGGLATIQVWRVADGWHYDGPSSAGPAHVRQKPKGVCWSGPIDADHAAVLLARLQSMTDHVDIVKREKTYVA